MIATTIFIKYSTIPIGAVRGGFLGLRPTIMTIALASCSAILLLKPLGRVRDFPERPGVGRAS